MSRNVLFIVNPNSGKRNSNQIIGLIKAHFPKEIPFEIGLWTNIGEFNLLAQKLKGGQFTDAVAVGGDGSVNLVGRTVLNTGIVLGIVPSGSGNGLARSLGISVETVKAVKQIAEGRTALIDNGSVNGIPFFCTSGMGFDAHIGNLFASLPKRGLKAYIKLIAREFFSYSPKDYVLSVDGVEYKRRAFLITVANAGQYGNDFYVAPEAKLNDGIFHVAVFKPFGLLAVPAIVLKFMRRKAHKSRFIETFTCTRLEVKRAAKDAVHFDGEPEFLEAELRYEISPQSLKVIIGEGFNGI